MWKLLLKALGAAVAGSVVTAVAHSVSTGEKPTVANVKGAAIGGALVGLTGYLTQAQLPPPPVKV